MNAPFQHTRRGGAGHSKGCNGRKHPAVLVWPTAAALSWLLLGTIGWLVATIVS